MEISFRAFADASAEEGFGDFFFMRKAKVGCGCA